MLPLLASDQGKHRMADQPLNTSSVTHPDTRHHFNRHRSNLIRKTQTPHATRERDQKIAEAKRFRCPAVIGGRQSSRIRSEE